MSYIPERAMFVYAHPDDIEFGVAGTAAVWAKGGCEVTYVVITDGNVGSHEAGMTRAKLAEIRRAEQQAAADTVGVKHCVFLGYDDGLLEPSLALRKEIVRQIRTYRPNVVVCGDPRRIFSNNTRINHPDHRAAGTVTIDAVFPASEMRLLYPDLDGEGLEPHKVNYVYISHPAEPTYYVDISDVMDLKIEALRQHVSQLGEWDPEEPLKGWSKGTGEKVGFAYAEAYLKLTLKPIEEPGGDEEE